MEKALERSGNRDWERTVDEGASAEARSSLAALRRTGLLGAGASTARVLLQDPAVRDARVLASGATPRHALDLLVAPEFTDRDPASAGDWPVSSLRALGPGQQRMFALAGVHTVGELAALGAAAEEVVEANSSGDSFFERPSAPAELLPGLIRSVATSVRFTSFVRDLELRGFSLKADPNCVVQLPISGQLTGARPHSITSLLGAADGDQKLLAKAKGAKTLHEMLEILAGAKDGHRIEGGSLASIFEQTKCPVFHLGYITGHRQRWINLGTHLGEVVHSVSLAPGESRNIALVNWRRRQLTALEERTTTEDRLTATFVQNRALEEITSGVAREHQSGRTQTQSNTASTAFGLLGAGAATLGVAGGVTGAVIGGIIGTPEAPGVGTVIGAAAGGAVGAAVGGLAGVVAGGLVQTGAEVLGMIEAASQGDRGIVGDVQQRIALSTSQTASEVRSLWSTVVVEDTQAESVSATASNITNYNHMHALNIEYYELLQHYLTRLELETVQPILYLPFTFFDFTDFRFIRDYWDVVRLHVEDEALREQGDSYFVSDGPPEAPDLVVEPPVPTKPEAARAPTLSNLRIDVLFKSLPFNTNIGLDVLKGNVEISGTEAENGVPSSDLDGYDWGNRYTFEAIEDPQDITAVNLSKNQVLGMDIKYRVRVHRGRLMDGEDVVEDLRGSVIASNKTIRGDDERQTFAIPWVPAADFNETADQTDKDYREALKARAKALAINKARRAAFDMLIENTARFEQRLQRLVLRRRHYFTKVILNAIEPEELTQVLEALVIQHDGGGEGIPLGAIAHTLPIGMANGAVLLRLKRLDETAVAALKDHGVDVSLADVGALVGYADDTQTFFETGIADERFTRSDDVFVPTGGLFAESILGRANSAEYLDIERYFNWQDSPIPNAAPAIQPLSTDTRFEKGDVTVTVPEGNLQVINPVSLPEPTGLQGVLAAIQNPNLFRDMSKAGELATVVASLSALAGQLGQAASTMTGQAAQQTVQAASEASKAAAALAQSMMSDAFSQAGAAFSSLTTHGAALNKARELEGAASAAQATPAPAPSTGTTPAPAPRGSGSGSTTSDDIVRHAVGLPPGRPSRRNRDYNVRLQFESAHGVPISYEVLGDLGKLFRLFNERDVRDIPIDSSAELFNPIYVFPLSQWAESNGELLVQVDFDGGSFKKVQTVDFPAQGSTMIIRARIASRDQTIRRSRSTSRTQALTEVVQEKLGVSFTAAKKIVDLADFGFGLNFEDTESTTDADTTVGSVGTEVTEVVKVPTGEFALTVQFRD